MDIGFLPREDPGVFRTLLLPETADALAAGEAVTALGLTENGLALGAAAGYLTGDRFHVSSLYVAPAFRRRGGGALLLDTLQVLAVPYSGGLECAFTVTQPDHQTLIPFLEREGFFPEALADAALYRTTLGEIAQVPFFAGAEGGYGTPLDQLDEAALSLVERTLRSADAPLPEGGLHAPALDRALSAAVLRDNVPQALALVEHPAAGGLMLSSAWSAGTAPAALPMLLRSVLVRALAQEGGETALTVQTVSPASAALVRTLLPGAEPLSHIYVRPMWQ